MKEESRIVEPKVVTLFPAKTQKRTVPKYTTDFPIRCKVEGNQDWLEGKVSLISLKGIQVEIPSNFDLSLEQKLLLQLYVPGENSEKGANLLISGKIARHEAGDWELDRSGNSSDFWVEFDEMNEEGDEHYLFVDFLAYLLESGKARSLSSKGVKNQVRISIPVEEGETALG